jgi:hypothetical protein
MDRNRWSPCLGTAGHHRSESPVTIPRCAHPGRNLALFDPAQACGPATSRPVCKLLQTALIVAMNPVAQRLAVHAAKPRGFPAAETVEHHGNGQHARRLLGVPCLLGRRAQTGGTHIRSSNRDRCHLHPRESMQTASIHKTGPKGIPPRRVKTLGRWYNVCADRGGRPGGVAGGLARGTGFEDVPVKSGAARNDPEAKWRRRARSRYSYPS